MVQAPEVSSVDTQRRFDYWGSKKTPLYVRRSIPLFKNMIAWSLAWQWEVLADPNKYDPFESDAAVLSRTERWGVLEQLLTEHRMLCQHPDRPPHLSERYGIAICLTCTLHDKWIAIQEITRLETLNACLSCKRQTVRLVDGICYLCAYPDDEGPILNKDGKCSVCNGICFECAYAYSVGKTLDLDDKCPLCDDAFCKMVGGCRG